MFRYITKDIVKAASNNDFKNVNNLIKIANIDFKDKNGRTAIFYACINGNVEMCKLLIENNAKVNIKDDRKLMPIHYAVIIGNKEIINLLCSINDYNVDNIKQEVKDIQLKDKRIFLNLIKKIF